MKKTTKLILLIFIIIIVFAIYYLYPKKEEPEKDVFESGTSIEDESEPEIVEGEKEIKAEDIDGDQKSKITEEENNISSNVNMPASKKLKVAFIPQAPFHDWAEPWQNACEEAALLTAHHYIQGDVEVPKEQVKTEIEKMLAWQDRYFGSHKDLNAEEVAEMAKNYLDYSDVEVKKVDKIEDVKAEIASGNVVVLPMAGRMLDNPHFTQPAPVYHMLAAIGYTENKIITNDPGTQLGKDLEYSYENFYDSIHDFVEGANESPDLMNRGGKVMVVLR